MKKSYLLIILFIFSTKIAWAKVCGCGSYENGTYSYTVGDKQGCCSGQADSVATYTTWAKDGDGIWTVDNMDIVDGPKAQKKCCN